MEFSHSHEFVTYKDRYRERKFSLHLFDAYVQRGYIVEIVFLLDFFLMTSPEGVHFVIDCVNRGEQ